MSTEAILRWKKRLSKELSYTNEFMALSEEDWINLLKKRHVTSSNQDTVLALDWPHYCGNATKACGGSQGWCYTFQGNQATKVHDRHVAMVDVLARKHPHLFAQKVASEVHKSVESGEMKYPNIRYSGSGEFTEDHLPALQLLSLTGVHLWGFSRNIKLAAQLRKMNASVIISIDKTSPSSVVEEARANGFNLAYTSDGVYDQPPPGTIVTFPVHRIGRVHEVVDVVSLCPKVVMDFLDDSRPSGTCQLRCMKCHLK